MRLAFVGLAMLGEGRTSFCLGVHGGRGAPLRTGSRMSSLSCGKFKSLLLSLKLMCSRSGSPNDKFPSKFGGGVTRGSEG